MTQHKKIPLLPDRGTKLTREKLNEHFHANLHFARTWTDVFADFLTLKFGTITFLLINGICFVIWFVLNVGVFGNSPFDPFPFNLLTMTVSLEAIFLSIIVLISQNKQSKIDEIRQQIDFEINVRSEEEITKILELIDDLRKVQGIKRRDPELEMMKEPINLQEIQEEAEKQNNA
jgi:uncharacterized membrane protein